MKKLNGVVTIILGLALNLVLGPHSAMAQTNSSTSASDDDLATMLEALETTTPMPASELPDASEIKGVYSAANPDAAPSPADVLNLPVWPLGDGFFVLDDTHLTDEEKAESEALARSFMADGFTPGFDFSTNDLSLEILSETNGIANLVINPPWDETNGVYDLLETTNLTSLPIDWQWVLRSAPGQTSLVDLNATNAQEFYALGLPNDLIANDSLGTDFWVGYVDMLYNSNRLILNISSQLAATGTVAIPNTGFSNNFSVAAMGVTSIFIPLTAMMTNYDTVTDTNAIHITASQPVSVYAYEFWTAFGGAFTCYPTPMLGTNYCVMARPSDIADGPSFSSQFAVVATEDNTTVNIMPSSTADLLNHGTNFYTLTNLLQGQAYQIYSVNYTDDVTGTSITSDKPIAVFAGAGEAVVPTDAYDDLNPLVQEQLPVESWGTQALALSFAGRTNGDSYRVLAASSNTVVTISGTVVLTAIHGYLQPTGAYTNSVVTNLQSGQFYDVIMEGPAEFQGSQPIQVAHFGNGHDWYDLPNDEGDPCEILLPATGYYLQTNIVYSFPNDDTNGDFNENFLTIIAPQSATNSTRVDGLLVAVTNFVAITNSGYFGAQMAVSSNSVHTVTSSQPVGVEVYGWGHADAYGYFGGVVK